MRLKDEPSWKDYVDANEDDYGRACVEYAERWANVMEERMAAGAKLEDVAGETSHEADTEGITGFMYYAAVLMLSECWEHGEALRRWHNLRYQMQNEGERANEEGGVLDPAVVSIAVEEEPCDDSD